VANTQASDHRPLVVTFGSIQSASGSER
jgi:endonuclease/exonuclease/phosphatase (EEP) superfamily protein YafD